MLEELEPISKVGQDQAQADAPINPVQYHTHDGVDSPELDFSPAGNDGEIQFNDNGSFGSDEGFKYNKNTAVPTITFKNGIEIDTQDTNGIFIYGSHATTNSGDEGAAFEVDGGDGYPGGSIGLYSGHGLASTEFDNGDGGDITIEAGNATNTGSGGNIYLQAGSYGNGQSNSGEGGPGEIVISSGSTIGRGDGGGLYLNAGGAQSAYYIGGNVEIKPGNSGGGTTSGRMILVSQGSSGQSNRFVSTIVNTINATPVLMASSLIQIPEDKSVFIEAKVLARRDSFNSSAGSNGDSASYIRRATYKRNGTGAATLVGSIQDGYTAEDQAGWDCTFALDGNNVHVQVTGAANNTIVWYAELFYIVDEGSVGSSAIGGVTTRYINEVNSNGDDIYINEDITINII